MTATLASQIELARFLNIEGTIPDRKATGSARAKETVGTGDASATLFYLDKAYVLNDSYTLYHGDSEANATALTDSTHYSLDRDNGTVTLTSAGVTLIDVGNIYADYSYNTLELTGTIFQDALDRAENEINDRTDCHWADGTSATPDYQQVTNEKHTGKGRFDRAYFLDNFPLPDVKSTVNTAAAIGATALLVSPNTNGFLSSGYILAGENKVKYDAKASDAFLDCSDITTAVSVGATVVPTIIEISTTDSGTNPSWTIVPLDSDFDIDFETGRVHLFKTDYDLTYYALQYPPRLIPNRFRATYIWGDDTIPGRVKRLCLMLATKDLIHSGMRKTAISGQAMSVMETMKVDEEWIEKEIESLSSMDTSTR